MEPIIGGGARPGGAADVIRTATTQTFMKEVVEASRQVPVIVDFWAPWCGPCKQLGPIIEKVVREAGGAVRLVKIDTDENPEIAQQMRIQSIPAVYAFKDGRPVDGFVGALPESQIRQFVKRLGGPAKSPVEEALEMAREAYAEGAVDEAAGIWQQVVQHEPENVEAIAGLARVSVDRKDFDGARALLDKVPAAQAGHAEVAAVRAAIELAEAGAKAAGAAGELRARLARDPKDHAARFELATGLFAGGEREAAIDELLEIVRRDRAWNEEAARKQLVKLFEAMGPTDPLTLSARRRLSSILFS